MLTMCFCAICLMVAGTIIPSFRFVTMGIVGKITDMGDSGTDDRPHSILSLTSFVQGQAGQSVDSVLGINFMCYLFLTQD